MPAPLTPADGSFPRPRAADVDPMPPADRLTIMRRGDAIVVRVRSEGSETERLPDAVFSFRCGDPQYAYWASRVTPGDDPAARPQASPPG